MYVDSHNPSVGAPFVYVYENMIDRRTFNYDTPGLPENTTAMRQLNLTAQQQAWWSVVTNETRPYMALVALQKFQLLEASQRPIVAVKMASDDTKAEDLPALLRAHVGAALPYRDETDRDVIRTLDEPNPNGNFEKKKKFNFDILIFSLFLSLLL